MSEKLSFAQEEVYSTVSEWPDVRTKLAFGHRGFVRGGKMFGFCADDGLAVRVWPGVDPEPIYAIDGVHPFAPSGMDMRSWAIFPLRNDDEIETALSAVRDAYERSPLQRG